MQLFYQPEILSGVHNLDVEESRHCIRVLRHKSGDSILIVDGRGSLFTARITDANPKKCSFTVISHERHQEKDHFIHLAIAPTKSIDRIEWFIEKAVEIGIDEISFFFGKHSERKKLKMDRINKKAVAAMKQSGHYSLPQINLVDNFEALLDNVPDNMLKAIAYVDKENSLSLTQFAKPKEHYCILIGPEGDFDEVELLLAMNKGFAKVSLGPYRLRTETAALVACLTLNIINQ